MKRPPRRWARSGPASATTTASDGRRDGRQRVRRDVGRSELRPGRRANGFPTGTKRTWLMPEPLRDRTRSLFDTQRHRTADAGGRAGLGRRSGDRRRRATHAAVRTRRAGSVVPPRRPTAYGDEAARPLQTDDRCNRRDPHLLQRRRGLCPPLPQRLPCVLRCLAHPERYAFCLPDATFFGWRLQKRRAGTRSWRAASIANTLAAQRAAA